jgi:hypothetical protein
MLQMGVINCSKHNPETPNGKSQKSPAQEEPRCSRQQEAPLEKEENDQKEQSSQTQRPQVIALVFVRSVDVQKSSADDDQMVTRRPSYGDPMVIEHPRSPS